MSITSSIKHQHAYQDQEKHVIAHMLNYVHKKTLMVRFAEGPKFVTSYCFT